ncbi:MAG: RecQ family ATP-dependent DNA helicase [Flavobacteriaceae bacterium]|nr:RecQ family ATP-dependent DNA helicase [Flavobacteriaceae bacterium]
MTSPYSILHQYWGYESFKPRQEEIIDSVVNGRHSVALLPTGGGKSLCYQIPSMMQPGLCIVVSPLVALMNDQVQNLKSKGIKALSLVGGISFDELTTLLDNALYGNYKFLYLSPERLQQELVQNAIRKMNVNLIAVDEAHCISQWGNDFRPAYRNIQILMELQPFIPVLALTATATSEVLEDTIAQLNLKEAAVFKSSFARENLVYQVIKENDKVARIAQLLQQKPGSAIVYVRSRKNAESVASNLNNLGISSTFYHGGLHSKLKNDRLQAWKSNEISTMVATNAFGMGIDHPEVRNVIHIQLPESIESYYQEAGRAGRDGKLSFATLLFNEDDIRIAQKQYIEASPSTGDIKTLYRHLNNYFQISYGEGEYSNHSFNFNDFCNTYSLNTLITFNGLNTLDRLGIIQLSKEFGRKSMLKFLVSSERLLKHFDQDMKLSVVGKTILRMYGGIFETKNRIDLNLVSKKIGIHVEQVISALKEMEKLELAEIQLHETDASLTFLLPREDEKTINPWAKDIDSLKKKKGSQLGAVLDYLNNKEECRSIQLVRYFGEELKQKCGLCDYCVSIDAKEVNVEDISEEIINLLRETTMNSREIAQHINHPEKTIIETLRLLLDAGKIKLNQANKYSLT